MIQRYIMSPSLRFRHTIWCKAQVVQFQRIGRKTSFKPYWNRLIFLTLKATRSLRQFRHLKRFGARIIDASQPRGGEHYSVCQNGWQFDVANWDRRRFGKKARNNSIYFFLLSKCWPVGLILNIHTIFKMDVWYRRKRKSRAFGYEWKQLSVRQHPDYVIFVYFLAVY